MGDHPISPDQVSMLLCTLAQRGVDAAGIVTMTGDKVAWLKAPMVSWEFATSKGYEEFVEENITDKTDIVMLHARGASPVGNNDPFDNRNNHPLTAGATCLMHNGFIHNHDWYMKEHKYEKSAETDSDVMRAILDEHGITPKGISELSKLTGHAAISAVSPAYPGKLLLGRSGNPVAVAYNEELQHFMWASEKHMLFAAGKTYAQVIKGAKENKGIWFYKPHKLMYGNMNGNSAWIMSREKGLEYHGELRICVGNRDPRTYNYFKDPKWREERERKRKASEERRKRAAQVPGKQVIVTSKVECPGCAKIIPISEDLKKVPLWDIECRDCESPLATKPAGVA